MTMLNHVDSEAFAGLVKGSPVTIPEQILLRSVGNLDWGTFSLDLSDASDQRLAAWAVALGCPLFYAFANFYVLGAPPHQASLERVNRAKARPPLQVGSIST